MYFKLYLKDGSREFERVFPFKDYFGEGEPTDEDISVMAHRIVHLENETRAKHADALHADGKVPVSMELLRWERSIFERNKKLNA